MRVLVTGATGFVGRAVVGQLTMAGHSVIGFARTSKPCQCELRTGDILDQAALDHAVEGADAVCHLAALTLVRQSFEEPVRYFRVNVTGTLNLLDAMNTEARRSGRKLRLVFASTGAVYGAPETQPITEAQEPAPGNPVRWGPPASEPRELVLACATAALAGMMLAGCGTVRSPGAVSTGPVPGSPVPASAISRLRVIAERILRMDAHAAPAWVSVVTTTRQKALALATPGDIIPGSAKTIVYLLTMKGRFTDYLASVPPGASLPTGRYVSDVIDAKTFQGLDFGLGPNPPPVSAAGLGPVTYLKGLAYRAHS